MSRLCPAVVGTNSVTWRHDDPAFMQRVTIVAERGGDRLVSTGEMARDGSLWGPDLSQLFVRR